MPLIELQTNLPTGKLPSDLAPKLANILSNTMDNGLSSDYFAVHIQTGQYLYFMGNTDPMIICHFNSTSDVNPKKNELYTVEITGFINSVLGIPEERILIFYNDRRPQYVGWNGKLC